MSTLDLLFKADTRADFEAFALARGWLIESDKQLWPAPGVDIDHIGQVRPLGIT